MNRLASLGIQYHTECTMCKEIKPKATMYSLKPHQAIIKLLSENMQQAQTICNKCAKRELKTEYIRLKEQ